MPDGITTREAAERLSTSPVTVRKLIDDQKLRAVKEQLGGARFRWVVDPDSVEALARATKPRGPRPLADRVAVLEQALADIGSHGAAGVQTERDDLRARVVALEEVLVRMRAASELQREAAELRAGVVSHLLAAIKENESADELNRKATAELEEAAASATRAGHLGQS